MSQRMVGFDPDAPAGSGVLLRVKTDYETLTLRELRRLDLRRMRLATLASCLSAASVQLPGRERICVPTALLDAGVGAVVASLWPVPVHDDSACELMTELYTRVLTGSTASALREVQSEWRRANARPRRGQGSFTTETAEATTEQIAAWPQLQERGPRLRSLAT